nr:MAG TPA: hypothetical protein [Caudoviricetes sp.]
MNKIVLHRFVKKKFALDFIGLTKSLFKSKKKEYPCRNTLFISNQEINPDYQR